MIADIEDRSYMPDMRESGEFIQNDAFDALNRRMASEYQAICKIEYSGDKVLLGWNVKYKKAGRTLCTVYPREGHFPLLLVVGQKEKARVEALLPALSDDFCRIYNGMQEGMGQRWLLFDISADTQLLEDILRVVRIRRESR